ncbi:D-2-hydroxyacid dehydrogenase family protein [Arthrobacter sp. JUb115]|uniref:D-2-hydroxyacid dehydrogenase family protein n=1 Tax=Arthrobacter sp. JUb115 TaxID=2485108 RepID=UPI00105E155C|nr:D-2-hydroxyacid dehydrogenase family protein [Arthrobacter sp. JUb115]TDU24575.1 lactate dehydrogenase-like 2-hydroxyacid dehydrogenase [Arthrobacter sp. JUb115]
MRIAILDDYHNVARSLADFDGLAAALDAEVTVFTEHLGHEDSTVVQALQPFDAIVAMRERTPFPAARLTALPNLKLLVTTGRRNGSIDLQAAKNQGIVVSHTGYVATDAAEHTWALILSAARRLDVELFSADRPLAAGSGWQTTFGLGLSGKTLGVYGLGNLGAKVAKVGLAFGMRVIAYSQNLTKARATEVGVELVSEAELFSTSDIVTVHLKLSERSTGVIAPKQLAWMRPDSILVNTSRSRIVQTDALIDALDSRQLHLAAVDVFDVEPLPAKDRLAATRGVIATPHIGYVTIEQFEMFYRDAVEDIRAWASGAPIRVLA